jgi:hypothetical protein
MGIMMQTKTNIKTRSPWYGHRWPWLLALGPVAVIAAGVHTTWLAFSRQDALVVDDYYKQGKAINQDLRRDRVAAALKMSADIGYDPARAKLAGSIYSLDQTQAAQLTIKLIHPTQPAKDIRLEVRPDRYGNFEVELPMLELGRWQVLIENQRRDWRLRGVWAWPQKQRIELRAE